ncbi:MAG: DUF4019 domain-containing protein [Cyanobacteria bacterium P01_G01_bin.19]
MIRRLCWIAFLSGLSAMVSLTIIPQERKLQGASLLNVSNQTLMAIAEKCMNIESETPQAIEAAQNWLALVDNSDYTSSWSDAAQYFQNVISAERWETTLQGVRQPLGKIASRKVKSKQCTNSLPGAPDGEYIVIQYQTSFEHKKAAIETVTLMLNQNDLWKVAGYFID